MPGPETCLYPSMGSKYQTSSLKPKLGLQCPASCGLKQLAGTKAALLEERALYKNSRNSFRKKKINPQPILKNPQSLQKSATTARISKVMFPYNHRHCSHSQNKGVVVSRFQEERKELQVRQWAAKTDKTNFYSNPRKRKPWQ